MTSRYRHRRTPLPATPFPSPIEPGEIVVNTANRQLAVGDAAAGTLGQPKPLIGVRFFDPTAAYVLNDVVTQTGKVYRANGSIAPGAFNASSWTEIGAGGTAVNVASDPVGFVSATNVQAAIAELDAEYHTADAAIITAYQNADTALQTNIDGKVAKAGDTMAGHLSLPTGPGAANAVRKDYVDAADATLTTSVNGKVAKAGDTMGGQLLLYADPVLPLEATTKQYVDGWIAAAGGNAVKYIAQSLTAPQQQQARQNIYAAPFDALAYSGLQINGGMEVNQENVGLAVNGATKYCIDGWQASSVGSQTINTSQHPSCPPGFTASTALQVNVANAAPSAGHLVTLRQPIEGYRIARLAWGTANAQPITLGFWIYAVRPGNYSGSIVNGAANRCYPFAFTINAASTWEYKTVTIPGDTTGTWAKDNTIGMYVTFAMMVGSTYQSAAGAWAAGNFCGATGSINGVAATSDVMLVTGVTVHPGNEAPAATRSPFIVRPFDQELQVCKRYFEKSYNYAVVPGSALAVGAGGMFWGTGYTAVPMVLTQSFSVEKRATPTMKVYDNGGFQGAISFYSGSWQNGAAVTVAVPLTKSFAVSPNAAGPSWWSCDYTADARLP
jgi:hypothetical protein